MRDLILPSTSVLIVPLPAATVDYKGKMYLLLPALYKSSNRLDLGSKVGVVYPCISYNEHSSRTMEVEHSFLYDRDGSVCAAHRTNIEVLQHRCVEGCYFIMFLLREDMDISGRSPTVNETIKWHLVYLFLSLICYPKEIKIDIFIVYSGEIIFLTQER